MKEEVNRMGKTIYDATKDPKYSKPFIDVDEPRERVLPDGTRLPYRYMHGGFEGTDLKFSFCFPPEGSLIPGNLPGSRREKPVDCG